MSDNKAIIQFLRGTTDKINTSTVELLPGQPLFDTDSGLLYVGTGNEIKSTDPIKAGSVENMLVITAGSSSITYDGSEAKEITITHESIGAAAANHGNHVPTTEAANNAKFLRNDNTWATVTPDNIGAATAGSLNETNQTLTNHINAKSGNPHGVTKSDVELGSVVNDVQSADYTKEGDTKYFTQTGANNLYKELKGLISGIDQFKYVVSTNAATTPKDVIWGNVTGTLTASADTEFIIYLVPTNAAVSGSYVEYLTIKTGSAYVWEVIGTTEADLSDYQTEADVDEAIQTAISQLDATVTADAGKYIASITQVDGKITNITQENLPTTLNNANSLTITGNGTKSFEYDGSEAKTLNIKPEGNITVKSDTSGEITIGVDLDEYATTANLNNKLDKTDGVTNVAFDSTNKKFTQTINGASSDIVTVANLKNALNLNQVSNVATTSTVTKDSSDNITSGAVYALQESLKGEISDAKDSAISEAKSDLIGSTSDATSSNTIYGAKNYAEEKVSGAQTAAAEALSNAKTELEGKIQANTDAFNNYYNKNTIDGEIDTLEAADANLQNQINNIKATADGAVQEITTGSTNGTINVDGSDVAVKGLGSAAYTDASAYDGVGAASTAEGKAKEYAEGLVEAESAERAGADTGLQEQIDSIKLAATSAIQSVSFAGTTLTKNSTAVSIDQAAARTALGLGSAAYTASTAYDISGAADTALEDAKTYVNTELTKYAIKGTTLDDYGITDAYTKKDVDAKVEAFNLVVDTALSKDSENPVQNKVVAAEFETQAGQIANKAPISHATNLGTYGLAGPNLYGHAKPSDKTPAESTSSGYKGDDTDEFARGDHSHPVQVDVPGNAGTATKLKDEFTLELSGDVTGDVQIDGSKNVNLSVNVADDSHNHVISNIDGLQAALDGKASTSHGTHVTYATATPKANGTGASGTSNTVARGDHVHPSDSNKADVGHSHSFDEVNAPYAGPSKKGCVRIEVKNNTDLYIYTS